MPKITFFKWPLIHIVTRERSLPYKLGIYKMMINKIGKKSKFEIKDIHHQGFCISVEIVKLYLCICNWIVILITIIIIIIIKHHHLNALHCYHAWHGIQTHGDTSTLYNSLVLQGGGDESNVIWFKAV